MRENHRYSFLEQPLVPDNPSELMAQITEAEARSYAATANIAHLEQERARLEELKTNTWAESVELNKNLKVDVMKAIAQKDIAEITRKIEEIDAKIAYNKTIVKIIDRRCSIGQSIIANITSQIKAGINL